MQDQSILRSNIILSKKSFNPKINLMYCNTYENVVNMFTKPIGKAKFEMLRSILGVVENPFLH